MNEEYRNMIEETATLFKAIGHPIRLCLLSKLCEYDEYNVTYFTGCMEASQSNISQHLSKLRDMGIVTTRREGTVIWYSLNNEQVRTLINTAINDRP